MVDIVSLRSKVVDFPYTKLKRPDGIKREADIVPLHKSCVYTSTGQIMAELCSGYTMQVWELV
jgi:hypothetical protein